VTADDHRHLPRPAQRRLAGAVGAALLEPVELLLKKRNTAERAINKLKQFHAVATRYDKRSYAYLGTTTAAALVIWLRS